MFSRVISAAVYGIDAYIVNVETDVGFGLPTFDMSGALGSKVREAVIQGQLQQFVGKTGFEAVHDGPRAFSFPACPDPRG